MQTNYSHFIKKIYREDKLVIGEADKYISYSYIDKSIKYIGSGILLYNNGDYEQAISIIYYSMYYMILSLLCLIGIKSENHTASIILLKELFNIDNSYMKYAKEERIDKQYNIDFVVKKDEIKSMITEAEIFNINVSEYIDSLEEAKIESLRVNFKKLIEEE